MITAVIVIFCALALVTAGLLVIAATMLGGQYDRAIENERPSATLHSLAIERVKRRLRA
jgi:hypothetical protein